MTAAATLVTPSYLRDRDRVSFLRESIEACEIDMPHLIVVPDAHYPGFRHLEESRKVTVAATSDVLPPELSRKLRRVTAPSGRTRRLSPLAHRWDQLRGRVYGGWRAQQFVKLVAGSIVSTPRWVTVDSDVFFLRHVDSSDFETTQGRAILVEHAGVEVEGELQAYRARSARLLGLSETEIEPRSVHTDQVFPFHAGVVLELLSYLEDIHGRPWWEAFAGLRATECETYGLFARHVSDLQEVEPRDRHYCKRFYSLDDVENFKVIMDDAMAREDARAAMVHSYLRCDLAAVHDAARRMWTAT